MSRTSRHHDTPPRAGPARRFRVILRRANGRFVREYPAASKYAAKQLQGDLEAAYDDGYYAEVRPV